MTLLWLVLVASLCAALPAWADEPGDAGADPPGDDDDSAADDDTPQISASTTVRSRRQRRAEEAHRDPASAVLIEIDPALLPPSASVADVLQDVAGVTIRRFGGPGDPSYVRIRGSSAQQVAVYVDGVPLNAHGSSAIDLSELDLASFDRIEVYRSAAPPELGAAPIGGVVHLRTRPDVAAPIRLRAGWGSWGTHTLSGGAGLAGKLPRGAVGNLRLSAAYDGTRGDFVYFDNHGTLYDATDDTTRRRTNNALDQLDVAGTARIVRGPLDLSLQDRLLWREGGVPGHPSRSAERARFGVTDNLLGGRLRLRLVPTLLATGDLSWRLRGERYRDPQAEIALGAQDSRDAMHEGGAGLGADWRPVPELAVLSSARLDLHTYTPRTLLPQPRTDATRLRLASTLAVSAPVELAQGRIAVSPTIRLVVLDDRWIGADPFGGGPVSDGPRVRVEPLPQLAVALRPVPELTIRAAASRGFRPPTFLELFGDRGSVKGNAALRPETGHSADLSARLRLVPNPLFSTSLEVGGFITDTIDAIALVPNSQKTAVPINLGHTRAGGVEAAWAVDALQHLHVDASMTWTEARVVQGERGTVGNRVPGVPPVQVDVGVQIFWDPWVRLGWRFDYTAGTFDSPSNFFLQAARPLHSAHLRLQPGPRLPWVALEVLNLTNTLSALQVRDPLHPSPDDRSPVSIEDYRGNPLPGRSVHLTIGWSP